MHRLTTAMRWVLFACIVWVTALIFIQVIFRNTGISISGFDEMIGIAAIWTYFLGMALATRMNGHIEGGLNELIHNDGLKKLLRAVSMIALLVFSAIGLALSIQSLATTYEHDYRTLYYELPVAISIWALVVGFALNIVFIVVSFFERKEAEG